MESIAVLAAANTPDFDTSISPEGWNDSTVSEAAVMSSPPPAKKRRLSLSLKKPPVLVDIMNQCFRSLVKDTEFIAAAKGVIPSNTKQCNRWACHLYNLWGKQRNE